MDQKFRGELTVAVNKIFDDHVAFIKILNQENAIIITKRDMVVKCFQEEKQMKTIINRGFRGDFSRIDADLRTAVEMVNELTDVVDSCGEVTQDNQDELRYQLRKLEARVAHVHAMLGVYNDFFYKTLDRVQ